MFITCCVSDSGELQESAQHIDLEESAEVADVAIVIYGWPAGVHAQSFAVRGDELVQLSRKGIEKVEGHRWRDRTASLMSAGITRLF